MPSGNGFTLLELLVAMAIFAVISVASFSGLQSVLATRAAVEAEAERLGRVQMAMHILERDIEQIVARSVRDEFGHRQAPLLSASGETLLTLTRAGWDNPLARPRASLQRLSYRLRETRLLRVYWDTLDRGVFEQGRETELLDGISDASVRFLDSSGHWTDIWPPEGAAIQRLPRALELRLTLGDWGELTRLLRLAGS